MLRTIITLRNNSNWTVMGRFKYQLPIPNTHQFTHLSPEAHTPLVQLPSPRPASPPSQLKAAGHFPARRGKASSWGRWVPQTRGQGLGGRSRAGLGGELHLQTKGGRAPAVWVGPGCSSRPSAGNALGPPPQRSLELLRPQRPGQHCHVPVTQTKEKEQPARGGGQQNPGWNKAGSTRAQAATKGLAHTKPATTVASSLTRHPHPPNPPTVPTSRNCEAAWLMAALNSMVS